MPSLLALSLPPPRNWQDFEDLCGDLWSKLWDDPDTQKNGRAGQAQKGVDIYGRPNRGLEWAGVQCKLKRTLSRKDIVEAVSQARNFNPPLSRFVIATAAPRDANLQELVRQIQEAERQAGSFSVVICFWEDISSKLNDFPELVKKYYPNIPVPSQGHMDALPKLEIAVKKNEELDFVSLVPAYSSTNLDKQSDRTTLFAHLSDIEIINNDSSHTEIRRLWLSVQDSETQNEIAPLEIKEELLTGNRRIDARSHRRYSLKFTSVFDGAIPQDGSKQVILRAKAIGLGELHITLGKEFWYPSVDPNSAAARDVAKPSTPAVPRPLRVFLCHSSGDKPTVRNLYKRLREDGFSPWLDEEDILGGQAWDVEIRKAVRAADIVIVCLSRGSITKAGYVQKEIRFALDVSEEQPEGVIYIIPVKLEECSVPESLSKWQWVNLFEEMGYERLLLALRARAGALGT